MYSIITIAVLVYIGYKLTQLVSFYAQNQKPAEVEKVRKQKRSSTLNPLFSEEEITRMKETSDEGQKCVEHYFDELFKKEKREIEVHHKSGKDKITFKPSEELIDTIVLTSAALVGRNNAMRNHRKMIESNIAILNGDGIEKVEKAYYDQPGNVWNPFSTTLSTDAWLFDKQVKEMNEGFLKDRKEFWRDSWTYILKKDYVAKEEEKEI